MKVLVAGATGAIGKRLIPLLVERGHSVTGMTRSASKADGLRSALSCVEPALSNLHASARGKSDGGRGIIHGAPSVPL